MDYKEQYLQETIRVWMSLLQRELGHYEQTCHGSLTAKGCNIKDVTDAIASCYESPGKHSISELSQRIDGFLEGKK